MARVKNTEMPNLFIIGAAKCGTTSLHHYLDLHPEISMSRIKEPQYFLGNLRSASSQPRVDSRDEYLGLFSPGTPVRGEATVAYSASPQLSGVAGRIAAEAPDAKLVYCVRDPIDRMLSELRMRLANRSVPTPRQDRPEDLGELLGSPEDPGNPSILRSRYMLQIREYLEYFPSTSILVIDADELREDRALILRSLFIFLGVDPDFHHLRLNVERNSSSTVGGFYARLRNNTLARRLTETLPEPARIRIVDGVRAVTGSEVILPEMDPELHQRLVEVFRPEVEALRDFTGQEFPGWSI